MVNTLNTDLSLVIINRAANYQTVEAKISEDVNNFLPKRQKLEGAALRKYLRNRKTKSNLFNRFSDTFTSSDHEAPPGHDTHTLRGASAWCVQY